MDQLEKVILYAKKRKETSSILEGITVLKDVHHEIGLLNLQQTISSTATAEIGNKTT